MEKKFKFIDLFCGIGGFHQALSDLGGECVFASDIDRHCQDVYERNYGLRPVGDITKVDAADIPEFDVLCGGFPCQAFSRAGKQLGFDDPTRGTLFFEIMRIVYHHHPKYIFLENVRNLLNYDDGNTWRVIHDCLDEAGYNVNPLPIVFSPHWLGIPQHRERVFIIAVRKDVGVPPDFTFSERAWEMENIFQSDDEIQGIERYRLKPEVVNILDGWNELIQSIHTDVVPCKIWAKYLCDPEDVVFDKEPSDSQMRTIERNVTLYMENRDFIDSWLIRMNRNPLFKTFWNRLEWQVKDKSVRDIWKCYMQRRQAGIRVRDSICFPTLVAMSGQTPIVGSRRRYLTPRECARLQSFPDSFIMDDNINQAYKQFGNSVNVECVKLFAMMMLDAMK